jgi:hypothetical protein
VGAICRRIWAGEPPPNSLVGCQRRAFDQGLGRSFWFANGGFPELIQLTISSFSPEPKHETKRESQHLEKQDI